MAYTHPSLHRIGGANSDAPVMWTYNAGSDSIVAVVASGYFDDAAADLEVGDLIYVTSSDNAAFGFVAVTSNDGSTVDVGDVTVVSATDAT